MQKWQITRDGIVVPSRLDPTGEAGPTPGQARGPHWRSPAQGWHVPTSVDSSQRDQRIVEAVVGASPGASATGWAALAWLEAPWFTGVDADGAFLDVPLALGHQRAVRRRPGVELSEDWLFAGDVIWIDGLPITVPERSVSYAARRASSLVDAVRIIDMAAFSDLIDLEGLAAYTARLVARAGVVRLREALALANENVWSPQETRMRLSWLGQQVAAGPLLCNPPVFDRDGRHLFTPDLLDPVAGVAGEYNGALHVLAERRRGDLDREERYRSHGLEAVTMMAGDSSQPMGLTARLHGAYARASGRRSQPRSWTLSQPHWWVDTSTVARRRALTEAERASWLRRRSA